MISPTSFSLCFALLLCLPLALLFTSPATTTTTIAAAVTTVKSKNYPHRKTINSPASPPPPPPDDDDSLFRLAAAQSNPTPSPPPHKIAFLFLTTTPLPFAPLWQLFFTHDANTSNNLFNIYIHADPTTSNYTPPFSGVFSGRVIPSKPTRRFTPSLIAAARRLLAHALLHDPSNSMFALLSPTCVPLHSFVFTYNSLVSSNTNKSFIEILNHEPGAFVRWAARGDDTMLPEVPFEKFRVGSQFFVLTRGHAIEVVRDKRLWSKFKLPCVRERSDVCYPEEHYFATLMNMKDPRGCVPATLTHVDWRGRSDGHPRTYEAAEVGPDLIRALRRDRPRYGDDAGVRGSGNGSDPSASQRNHAFLFARKFSPDSLQPLMNIANDVIFRD